ncbi:hypothetical protein J2T08_002126 [Neorhizobium galegae]|nr:hypothetical protein [Neorhizobium galegae]
MIATIEPVAALVKDIASGHAEIMQFQNQAMLETDHC